jgi:subtilase family serine protease
VVTSGQHKLAAVVDEPRALTEYNETNNVLEVAYTVTPPAASPVPTSAPSTARPNLIGTAITVNGRVPDGKDDCKDGKNAVSIRVKNIGAAEAGSFVVRLDVGGAPAVSAEQTVQKLAAGQEQEVRFSGVRFNQGEHLLYATVDDRGTVTESDESNNVVVANATCKDDD